jgi:hypothetical protein
LQNKGLAISRQPSGKSSTGDACGILPTPPTSSNCQRKRG